MRYFRVTLLVGALVSLAVAALYATGQFLPYELAFRRFLATALPPEPHPSYLQYGLFIALAFAVAWVAIDVNKFALKFVVLGGVLLNVLLAAWVATLYGRFVSPLPSLAAALLAFLAGALYSLSLAGRRKTIVRAIFGNRVSPGTFQRLVDGDAPLTFEGELRLATVVVCEILNHDELMDALPVADYVALNNRFLSEATNLLVDHGGYLDECDGESLRVVFGAPLVDELHARHACEAVHAMVQKLDQVNQDCAARWQQAFDFRVGINSGDMVLAAYGSKRLGTFSVAGEAVEFSRRLCAANSIFGSRVLIGSCTLESAGESIEVRPIDLIRSRFDRDRDEVYEFLAPKNALSDDELQRRDLFWKGVLYCREQRWDDAVAHFELALPPDRADGPAEFYLRKIEHLQAGLPALGWNDARYLSV